ncbi:MAG TPA: HAD hydrolase-like protein, partial [Oscillospiraceae bacterium]|jgi:phosphoglycolate phosphatase|nr:HAD hydrolase-like protein [Oscillospiraceae bacterium]
MSLKYNGIIFDFDGTVADTGDGIFNGVYAALDKMGIAHPPKEELRYFIGPPLNDSFHKLFGLNDEECDFAVSAYREYYSRQGLYEFELYEGMEQLLKDLKAHGARLGLASAKPEVFLKRIVDHMDFNKYFDIVAGHPLTNKHPDKSAVIKRAAEALKLGAGAKYLMVGDTRFDILGAKSLGMDSVGVLFGYGSREEFEEAGADYTVEKPSDILSLVIG